MNLSLLPLLHVQRDLYTIPRGGERFRTYLATMTNGTDDLVLPLTGMNPMGKEHVAALLDDLLAINAEAIATAAINEAIPRLSAISGNRDIALVVTDDAQGSWSNRYFAEFPPPLASTRRRAKQRSLRWAVVPIWTSERWTARAIREAVLTAIYRSAYIEHFGFPATLQQVMTVEGFAAVFADAEYPSLPPDDLHYTAEVLQAYRDTHDYPTIFTCLFGDQAARSVGCPPLGLSDRAGLILAYEEAQQRGVAPETVFQQAT